MNRFIPTLLILLTFFSGCKSKPNLADFPIASHEETNDAGVIDLLSAGEPNNLCDQELTSLSAIEAQFSAGDSYFEELTGSWETFYLPDRDIVDEEMAKTVQLLFNTVGVANRTAQAYELFHRETSCVDEDDTEPLTRLDTLRIIQYSQPNLPLSTLQKAFPDSTILSAALELTDAYAQFDGDDGESSLFSQVFWNYYKIFQSLPQVVSDNELEVFEKGFWSWYDKRQFVPEIDAIIRINLQDSGADDLSDEQISHFKAVVLSERDIDRRAILALEFAKFDHRNGATLLGEILESKIYTRYLLECWIAWRAYVQVSHSISSFSTIANNYYDKVRALCADTFVRHCLETDDLNAKCLLQNLIFCEILHRKSCLFGNESSITCMALCSEEFIDPRLLKSPVDTTFLGVCQSLPIDSFIKVLNEQPDIDIDFDSFRGFNGRAFCIVSLSGIPFGMNLQYEKEKIQSATFVNSRTDEGVIEKVVSVLSKNHGESDIAEEDESQYTWSLGERMLKARRLHTDDGGWTFFLTD